MEVKREIKFHESMTIDKRLNDFAYLRKNLLDNETPGMYPSADFSEIGVTIPSGWILKYFDTDLVSDTGSIREGVTIIANESTNVVRFYETVAGTQIGSDYTSTTFRAAARDNDGALHVNLDVSNVEQLHIIYSPSFVDYDGNFTVTDMANAYLCKFDGLDFFWLENSTGSDIFRSAPQSTTNTLVFDDIGFSPNEFDFYGDQMVIFGQDSFRKDIYIVFWDKTNSTLFDKRIIEKNCRFIAGGVVDGRLMLIKAIGNTTNLKEKGGKLSINVYDGEKFVEVNSIKTAGSTTQRSGFRQHQSIGNGVLMFGVEFNEDDQNEDLYRNYIFKVYADGRIEALRESTGKVSIMCHVGYDELAYAENTEDVYDSDITIRSNGDSSNAFGDYDSFQEGSTYITNFLNNSYNFHKLETFAVAFEKLYEQTDTESDPVTGEELDVYYRVSERDDWALLMNVTAEKVKDNVNSNRDQSTEYASDTQGLPEQRYFVTQLPDDSPLPSYNEIQFKFVSKRGFSVIGAWYGYSYLSRNTLE